MAQKFITIQRISGTTGTIDNSSLELNTKTPDRLIVIGGLPHCCAIQMDREARAQMRRWFDELDASGTP